MAVKVNILSVILVICLIDSLQCASFQKVKRGAEDGASGAESTTPKEDGDKGGSSDKEGNSGNPMDMNKIVDNIGQMFTVNGSPDWMKNANTWFTNMPSMPTWLGGGSGGGNKN